MNSERTLKHTSGSQRRNGNHHEAAGSFRALPAGTFSANAGREKAARRLQVMKFGGTSVADAGCIRGVVEIIRSGTSEANLLVVVSAMAGVTNKLVEAANQAEAGNSQQVHEILQGLRRQHERAVDGLIQSIEKRKALAETMDKIFQEGERLCQGTLLLRELTLRARDAISSLGERLSAPMVAAALQEHGVASEAVEATEVIVTDFNHGNADPHLDLTRERCEARLRTSLKQGIVPVVTGFIGATTDGALTTLGRGGSDYSATILGAVLNADEVIIWTDVDGILTADPRLVANACTIAEVSYREASELAYFGAKVLHPKTLRPVSHEGIPVWIRNTFSPEKPGTRISPVAAVNAVGVTAITAVAEAALITVGGPGIATVPDLLGRTIATTRDLRTDVLLISQSSSQNDTCVVVPAGMANRVRDELRREFAEDLAYEKVEHINVDATVAVVTVVGQQIRGISGIMGRTFSALSRAGVDTIAVAHGASECNLSFVVAKQDMRSALDAIHREFQLGEVAACSLAEKIPAHGAEVAPGPYAAERFVVDAD